LILIFILKIGLAKSVPILVTITQKKPLAKSVPILVTITQNISLARSVPNFVTITHASSPPRGHKVSGQKLSAHIDKSSKQLIL